MDFFAHPLPYLPDAAPYFAALVDLPHAVWLDSAGRGRYDILVAAPLRVLADPGQLEQVILRALEKAPGRRFDSAEQMSGALAVLLAGELEGPQPESVT